MASVLVGTLMALSMVWHLGAFDASAFWSILLTALLVYGVVYKVQRRASILQQSMHARYEEARLALEAAETAHQAQSQFLADKNHDIRTLMNGVLGVSHLLLDTRPNPQQIQYIQTIEQSARHLLVVVNEIMNLAKVESRQLILDAVRFDLHHTVSQTVSLFTPQAASKDIDLDLTWDEQIPQYVRGDPVRISQMLANLVSNAVKFTEAGWVRVRLHWDAEHQLITFTVQDSGAGLSDAQQQALHEALAEDPAQASRHGGTGLGLSIVQRLASAMGGRVGFSSQPGGGSSFWFCLPLSPCAAPENESVFLNTAGPRIAASQARILMVEDHPVSQMLLSKLLLKFGFVHIDTVTNGAEALAATSRKHYDMVLMDGQMPVMDGLEATRRIRAHEQAHPHQARHLIVAMTASTLPHDIADCLNAGMDDYFSKPVDPLKLNYFLSRWFISDAQVQVLATDGTSAPPVDQTTLLRIAQDPATLRELLDALFTTGAEKIQTLRMNRRLEEQQQWVEAAHQLRGAAASLGMHALSARCEEAEQKRSVPYPEKMQLIEAIQTEFERVQAYATHLLAEWSDQNTSSPNQR